MISNISVHSKMLVKSMAKAAVFNPLGHLLITENVAKDLNAPGQE